MTTSIRPPSVAWEPLQLADKPGIAAWVWYCPSGMPNSIQFHVTVESSHTVEVQLSVAALATSAGIGPEAVQGWEMHGVWYDLDAGAAHLWQQPLPIAAGSSLQVSLRLRPVAIETSTGNATASMGAAPAAPPAAADVPSSDVAAMMDALEASWLAIEQIERQLEAARKQLANIQGRLQSLNRDLNPDERLHADNLDRKDWTDARRWLRDASAQVSRYIREYDIGAVSSAGGRTRFAEIYRDYIAPRRPFEGLIAVQLEFEQYRKTHQSLLLQMQSTLASAQRDAEQRAQQILGRIASKVRAARTKR